MLNLVSATNDQGPNGSQSPVVSEPTSISNHMDPNYIAIVSKQEEEIMEGDEEEGKVTIM